MSYILSISCAAGSNFIHPTEDEAPPALVEAPVEDHEAPTALVEEPVEDHEAPPALVEAPVEDDSEGDFVQRDFECMRGFLNGNSFSSGLPVGHTHEDIDQMFSRIANGMYLSSLS